MRRTNTTGTVNNSTIMEDKNMINDIIDRIINKQPVTKEEWDEIRKLDRETYMKLYCDFMYNECNRLCCNRCPENIDELSYERHQCGQYNCWVDCHCRDN